MKFLIAFTVAVMMISSCSKTPLNLNDKQGRTSISQTKEAYPDFQCEEEKYAYAKKYYAENKAKKSIEAYHRLLEEYPTSSYAAEAYFMMGYLSGSQLSDTAQARKNYNYLIKNYPDSDFSPSAKFELQHLGNPNFIPVFEKEETKEKR